MQLNLVSESQEIELGKQAEGGSEQAYGVYKRKKRSSIRYVEGVGKNLAAPQRPPNLPYRTRSSMTRASTPSRCPRPFFITRGILGT